MCRGAIHCALLLRTDAALPKNHGRKKGVMNVAPTENNGMSAGAINYTPTVGGIVRAFKAQCTHAINQMRNAPNAPVWQRNYYEHIIRSEPELHKIREYIVNNPLNWEADENYKN